MSLTYRDLQSRMHCVEQQVLTFVTCAVRCVTSSDTLVSDLGGLAFMVSVWLNRLKVTDAEGITLLQAMEPWLAALSDEAPNYTPSETGLLCDDDLVFAETADGGLYCYWSGPAGNKWWDIRKGAFLPDKPDGAQPISTVVLHPLAASVGDSPYVGLGQLAKTVHEAVT